MANQRIAQTPSAYGFLLFVNGWGMPGSRTPRTSLLTRLGSPIGSSPGESEASRQVLPAFGDRARRCGREASASAMRQSPLKEG
jgi:hypothetical protein